MMIIIIIILYETNLQLLAMQKLPFLVSLGPVMIVIDYNLLTDLMKLCTIRSYVLELCSTVLS
jgi:hypothetical protein